MLKYKNIYLARGNMKVLMILSKHFITDPRVQKEAETLSENGHEVSVIVWDRKGDLKPYEEINNINIHRIRNSFLMKILPNNILRNPLWWRKAYKKGIKLHEKEFRFDAVHCHDLDTLQAGVWIKQKTGCKLVYDAHEIFGYMIEGRAPRYAVKKAFSMENKLLRYVDQMITVSEPFKEYYSRITDKPITIVMNCKELRYKKYEQKKNKIFTILYIGGMSKLRFFPEIVDIIGNIPDVKFKIAGLQGWLYDEVKKRSKKYKNIEFLGTIPTNDILKLTRQTDTVYLMVDPSSKQMQLTLFNKQFEAMVCGTPIITTKGIHAGNMTEKLKCGLTVDYNAESIKKAIIQLRDNPSLREKLGKNAFKAAQNRYNWEKEKEKLLKIYEELK